MYRVEIYKTIWAGEVPDETRGGCSKLKYVPPPNPECVSFKYSLDLPFAPFIGLFIIHDIDEYNFRSGEIKQVTWFHHDELFACFVDDEHPYTFKGYDYKFEWLVEHAGKGGWKRIDEPNS
jgi:hypothetical protein